MLNEKAMSLVNKYVSNEIDCSGHKVIDVDLRSDVVDSLGGFDDFDSLQTVYETVISKMLSKGYVFIDLEDGEDFEDAVIEGSSLDIDEKLFNDLVKNTKLEKVFVRK